MSKSKTREFLTELDQLVRLSLSLWQGRSQGDVWECGGAVSGRRRELVIFDGVEFVGDCVHNGRFGNGPLLLRRIPGN